MTELWKPQPSEVYKNWLALIDEQAEDLTNWETRFINDIRSKVNNGWALTQTQAEKLEDIYCENTE